MSSFGWEGFRPEKEFLVCIDSDGCMLDNMELKHKECFCPATINVWNLQSVSRYVRPVTEFVNLYSKSRGWNRFPALIRTLELAYDRKELKEQGYVLPDLTPLRKWIEETPVLGAAALEEYSIEHPDSDPILLQAAAWSREVDENIKRIVRNIKPFAGVIEALEYLGSFADVVVVSATPHEALVRELTNCGLKDKVSFICGQEMGTKAQCIRAAMGERYPHEHVLKVGDALSDYKAAEDNGVFFYPIIPGKEKDSWKFLKDKYASVFKNGKYSECQSGLLSEFKAVLSDNIPW